MDLSPSDPNLRYHFLSNLRCMVIQQPDGPLTIIRAKQCIEPVWRIRNREFIPSLISYVRFMPFRLENSLDDCLRLVVVHLCLYDCLKVGDRATTG